jgi:hypothetical protein
MRAAALVLCVVLARGSESADVRTWKDKTDRFSILAELVESDGTKVKLKKADGQVVEVAIDRLCDADRQYLESQLTNPFAGPAVATADLGASSPSKRDEGPSTPNGASTGLRYAWKAGQNYVYKVKIEVDLGDESLEMTGNPSYQAVSADTNRAVLRFRGTLMENRRPKAGAGGMAGAFGPRVPRGPGRMGPRGIGPAGPIRPRMGPSFSPLTGVGLHGPMSWSELTVDPQGYITRQQGTSQLPFLLGNLSYLMIEPLAVDSQPTWTVENDAGIIIRDGIPRFGPVANTEGFVPARERTVYTVESATDSLVTIRKQYEFRAAATGDEKPPFEIAGDGKYTFDMKQGVSAGLDFTMTVTFRKGGLSIDIPVKVTYDLLDEAEQAKLAEEAEAARARMEQAARTREAQRQTPLSAQETADLLTALKSGDRMRVSRALRDLTLKSPEDPDPEVAKTLESMLVNQDDGFTRKDAAKALETWAIKENVPALIRMLGDESPWVRQSAMKALSRLHAAEAAEPIAARLADLGDRATASQSLKDLGPAAEAAVIEQLDSKDERARREACSILKAIGTSKCLPALEQTAKTDPSGFIKSAAKEAIAAVEMRQ